MDVNPIRHLVTAVRGLMGGDPQRTWCSCWASRGADGDLRAADRTAVPDQELTATVRDIDTPHGPARAHLLPAGAPRGALVLGHGAGGGVGGAATSWPARRGAARGGH